MDFFKCEQEILNNAEEFLTLENKPSDAYTDEYLKLYRGFKKLLKESKKLISLSDITHKQLKDSEEKLTELSIRDPLTGLLNRRGVYQWLDDELVRLKRNNTTLAIFIMDIDFFKDVNDTYGHTAGDYALQQLANLYHDSVREQDCIGRWGGEEFILVLPNTDATGAFNLGEKLRKRVEDFIIIYDNKRIELKISLGGCSLDENTTLDDCLKCADNALYKSKAEGRNKVTMHES
ncbi:MAG: GGDEF domain-containing protein [Spirochaetaceae bacterium]